MIKQYFFTITFLCSLFSFCQEKKQNEEEVSQSITVGIGTPYSTELETVGVNTRIYYNVSPHICFGPEISYFKKDESEVFAFDLIAHYIIETEIVSFYPLLGSNYTVEKKEFDFEQEIEESFGLVYGGGIHKSFNKWTVFAQYSRVALGITDEIFTVGLMYHLE